MRVVSIQCGVDLDYDKYTFAITAKKYSDTDIEYEVYAFSNLYSDEGISIYITDDKSKAINILKCISMSYSENSKICLLESINGDISSKIPIMDCRDYNNEPEAEESSVDTMEDCDESEDV